jgi:hypothetical protein
MNTKALCVQDMFSYIKTYTTYVHLFFLYAAYAYKWADIGYYPFTTTYAILSLTSSSDSTLQNDIVID